MLAVELCGAQMLVVKLCGREVSGMEMEEGNGTDVLGKGTISGGFGENLCPFGRVDVDGCYQSLPHPYKVSFHSVNRRHSLVALLTSSCSFIYPQCCGVLSAP